MRSATVCRLENASFDKEYPVVRAQAAMAPVVFVSADINIVVQWAGERVVLVIWKRQLLEY